MTDQMFVFLCRDVRKYVFDYRRGELQAAEQRKFEEHVASCEKCRDYVNRLEGMLDSAATQDPSPPIDRDALFGRIVDEARTRPDDAADELDRDHLFDRITAEIDVSDAPPRVAAEALALAEERPTEESEREELPRRPVALYVVAALAAGILIGIALPFLYPAAPPSTPGVAERPINAPDVASTTSPAPAPALALADLQPQPTPADIDDVHVFGDPSASWKIRTQGTRRKLDLDEGTVLVEFLPRDHHELEFVANQFTVRVTGTIFYASAKEGIVGVVTGSVEVDTAEGETVKLVDGQEWVVGEGLRRAPASVRPDVDRHVDVEAHKLALKAARGESTPTAQPRAKKRDAPRPPMSKEVVQTPREELRAEADRALREGRYAVAAQYYERMVEELSAADPANASLRLDLARIYIKHLGLERRALVHLNRFVEDRPDDPLTPTARAELCRIAKAVGEHEPACDP